jgi:hypothetical protein
MQEYRNNVRGSQSEVARIKAQIQAEHESAQRAMCSSAYGTCQHRFITKRMENMGRLHDQLEVLVGDEANRVLVEVMQRGG